MQLSTLVLIYTFCKSLINAHGPKLFVYLIILNYNIRITVWASLYANLRLEMRPFVVYRRWPISCLWRVDRCGCGLITLIYQCFENQLCSYFIHYGRVEVKTESAELLAAVINSN